MHFDVELSKGPCNLVGKFEVVTLLIFFWCCFCFFFLFFWRGEFPLNPLIARLA